MGYETNKFDREGDVEQGGWVVAWSDDITETDTAMGVVAAGVSVLAADPAPFLAWLDGLIQRTAISLGDNGKQQAIALATDAIKQALQGRSAKEITSTIGNVDFKAGAITYSGRNTIDAWGKTITLTRTWGMKVYVSFRPRSSPGLPAPPGTGPGIQDPPPVALTIEPPVYETTQILPYVLNSRSLRELGSPTYVRIPALAGDENILVRGSRVDNYTVEDPDHTAIITFMASLACAYGKQLRIASAEFHDKTIFAVSVTIIERDSI